VIDNPRTFHPARLRRDESGVVVIRLESVGVEVPLKADGCMAYWMLLSVKEGNMVLDANRMDWLARAQELKLRGELARRRDGAMARLRYEEAVVLFRELDAPLMLAHTIRHLGDVYQEQGRPDLAEPCYHEALGLYRSHGDGSSLDLANELRSLAVFRWEQTRTLWEEVRDLYTTLNIDAGIKESTARVVALSMR
jgi:tetratricopeptide (TPR) repeat protein